MLPGYCWLGCCASHVLSSSDAFIQTKVKHNIPELCNKFCLNFVKYNSHFAIAFVSSSYQEWLTVFLFFHFLCSSFPFLRHFLCCSLNSCCNHCPATQQNLDDCLHLSLLKSIPVQIRFEIVMNWEIMWKGWYRWKMSLHFMNILISFSFDGRRRGQIKCKR